MRRRVAVVTVLGLVLVGCSDRGGDDALAACEAAVAAVDEYDRAQNFADYDAFDEVADRFLAAKSEAGALPIAGYLSEVIAAIERLPEPDSGVEVDLDEAQVLFAQLQQGVAGIRAECGGIGVDLLNPAGG